MDEIEPLGPLELVTVVVKVVVEVKEPDGRPSIPETLLHTLTTIHRDNKLPCCETHEVPAICVLDCGLNVGKRDNMDPTLEMS